MSLSQIVIQVLEAAQADAERQTARDTRLDALAARLEDQAAMVLELTEAVKGLVARWDSVARPPALHPTSQHNGAPPPDARVPVTPPAVVVPPPGTLPKQLPRPQRPDPAHLLDRYLREKAVTAISLGRDWGVSNTTIGNWLRAEAAHRGPTALTAYHKLTREKRVYAIQLSRNQTAAQLGRTTPPGASP
jgi:hypothetical protein